MFRQLVVFLALASVALAAVSLAPLEPKPDKFKNVEGCYIADLGEVIPFGKSAPCKKHCMEYRCGSTAVQIVTCGTVGFTDKTCRVLEDHSKPYPACCPVIMCP